MFADPSKQNIHLSCIKERPTQEREINICAGKKLSQPRSIFTQSQFLPNRSPFLSRRLTRTVLGLESLQKHTGVEEAIYDRVRTTLGANLSVQH